MSCFVTGFANAITCVFWKLPYAFLVTKIQKATSSLEAFLVFVAQIAIGLVLAMVAFFIVYAIIEVS
ncbi:hypothetical protein Pan216_55410 [Planctomycetes bacterium Pan216]|uniref:Uncharacterized protein n=1 Tax=Kolteria novifilia TaxID=2527975 RepID=A0A518BCD3_9BACT|nr:hypothetical protein Pan216_55410 [Planctomycetes bacterium Pan216]